MDIMAPRLAREGRLSCAMPHHRQTLKGGFVCPSWLWTSTTKAGSSPISSPKGLKTRTPLSGLSGKAALEDATESLQRSGSKPLCTQDIDAVFSKLATKLRKAVVKTITKLIEILKSAVRKFGQTPEVRVVKEVPNVREWMLPVKPTLKQITQFRGSTQNANLPSFWCITAMRTHSNTKDTNCRTKPVDSYHCLRTCSRCVA